MVVLRDVLSVFSSQAAPAGAHGALCRLQQADAGGQLHQAGCEAAEQHLTGQRGSAGSRHSETPFLFILGFHILGEI